MYFFLFRFVTYTNNGLKYYENTNYIFSKILQFLLSVFLAALKF